MGGNLGFAAGPALGGYLATFLSYAWLFGVAALIGVLAFWLILRFLKESLRAATERVGFYNIFSIAGDRVFLIFAGLSLLLAVAIGQLGSTLSVFTVARMGFSTAQYGFLLTMNGLIVVFFQYPVARSLSRLSKSRALILGSLLYGLGYLFLGSVRTFALILAAIVVISAGEIVFSPSALSVVGGLSSPNRRGQYMGFFGLSEILGMSLGPLVGGILLDAFPASPCFIWWPIASLAFMAAAGFHWWSAVHRGIP